MPKSVSSTVMPPSRPLTMSTDRSLPQPKAKRSSIKLPACVTPDDVAIGKHWPQGKTIQFVGGLECL